MIAGKLFASFCQIVQERFHDLQSVAGTLLGIYLQ